MSGKEDFSLLNNLNLLNIFAQQYGALSVVISTMCIHLYISATM